MPLSKGPVGKFNEERVFCILLITGLQRLSVFNKKKKKIFSIKIL